MTNQFARIAISVIVGLACLTYALDFSGDEKLTWIFSDNGLEKPFDVQNFFSFNGKLYVLINPMKKADFNLTSNCCYTKSGVYEWVEDTSSWTFLMPRVSPYGNTDVHCTSSYCYVARHDLYKFVPTFNGTYIMLPKPVWEIDNIELRGGKIYSLGGSENNDVQVFDTVNEAGGWVELSSIADPIPETYAGGSQYLAATNEGEVYTVSAFVKKIYRWSPKLTIWHDVTYDLDFRNQLGACCGPLGRVRASSNGKEIYVSTEQGISWFRGDAWQKLTSHWGNKDFWVFENYLFSEGNRYELPGLLSSVSYDIPNTWFQNIFSPNGGKTVFSEIWNVTGGGGDGDRVFLGIARFTFPDNTGVLDLTTSAGFTRSLSIDYASYFGSVGEDDAITAFLGEMNSVEVVIFVANFNSTPSGISSNIISNVGWGTASSSGYVVVANAVTGNWIKAVRVGSAISSADQSRQTKRIALTVSEGILVLGADLTTVIHKIDTPTDREYKIAIATNDYFAVLAVNTSAPTGFPQTNLFLYDDEAQLLGSTDVSNNGVFSLEISSEENKVFVGGYNQIDPDLQLAIIRAYKISPPLEWAWKTFDHTLQELKDAGLTADTRVYHLFYEPSQGYLYYLAESAGPVSVVTRNGFDINTRIDVQTDVYTQPWGMKGAPHLLNYGKINPDNGQLVMSQYTFPRLTSTFTGNTMNAKDASFFVATDGKIYVAGSAACCIPGRDLSRLNCQKVGPYAGDAYLLIVNSDFTRRLFWTPFGAGGIGRGVAIGTDHVTVLYKTATNKTENVLYTTDDAQFSERINLASSDLHFLTFKIQQEIRNCTAQFLQDSLSFSDPDNPTRNPLVYPYAPWVTPTTPSGTSTASLAAPLVILAIFSIFFTFGLVN